MFGNTDIQPFGNFHSTTDFQSVYLLAGYYFGDFRIAGRVDLFATQAIPSDASCQRSLSSTSATETPKLAGDPPTSFTGRKRA